MCVCVCVCIYISFAIYIEFWIRIQANSNRLVNVALKYPLIYSFFSVSPSLSWKFCWRSKVVCPVEFHFIVWALLIATPLVQFSHSVVSDSFRPWITARQASLCITSSWSSLKLTSIESVMPSSHLILLSPSPPAPNPSQHQSLFQWVNSSHEVAKVLEFQL